MGQGHNELRRGQLSVALTRALQDARGSGGLERYGETLTPNIDLWSLPEWAYLRGEVLGAQYRFVAAGANNGAAAICNPLTSRSLVVVEAVNVWTAGQDTVSLYLGTDSAVVLNLSQLCARRDNRPAQDDGTAPGALMCRTLIRYADGTIAAIPPDWNVELERQVAAAAGGNVPADFRCLPIVLAPGRMLIVYNLDVASAMNVNFKFRERSNIDDER